MAKRDKKHKGISVELERLIRDSKAREPGTILPAGNFENKRINEWVSNLSDGLTVSGKTIDLLIEYSENIVGIDTFIRRIDEIIHEISDQYGGILSAKTLLNGVKQVTIMLEPGRISELMMRIAFIPQVEKIEEGTYFGNNLQPVDGLVGIFPYTATAESASKLRVVLKEEVVLGY